MKTGSRQDRRGRRRSRGTGHKKRPRLVGWLVVLGLTAL